MNEPLSESSIVKVVAQEAVKRCVKRAVRDMCGMKFTGSGDDTGLETIWDDICVQIQYEKSVTWDAYEQTVHAVVGGLVLDLPLHEKQAIWLQTEEGFDWQCDEPDERGTNPVKDDEMERYLVNLIYEEADRWSNSRIRAYIDWSRMRD